jgi:hypothetical protein
VVLRFFSATRPVHVSPICALDGGMLPGAVAPCYPLEQRSYE